MSNLDQEIFRRGDGSIDVGHYVALARRQRADQAATLKSVVIAKVRMLVSGVRAATKIGPLKHDPEKLQTFRTRSSSEIKECRMFLSIGSFNPIETCDRNTQLAYRRRWQKSNRTSVLFGQEPRGNPC